MRRNPSSSVSSRSLTRRTVTGPVGACASVIVECARPAFLNRGSDCRAGTSPDPEQQHELLLDVGRDRVLPPVGFAVHLLPLEPDDIDEESFGEAMSADDGRGEAPALVGEVQAPVAMQLDVAVVGEPSDRLGDGRGRQAEPLDEPGSHRHDALFLDREDRLEVLLGRVVHLGHGPRLGPAPKNSRGQCPCVLCCRRYMPGGM
jgi:hypothetical protein